MNCLLEFDRNFNAQTLTLIGTDEAGRGPGAGGVFAAAVCFKPEAYTCAELKLLNDSKKLSEKKREFLYDVIKEVSFYSIKMIDIEEIERINILRASLLAMHFAVNAIAKEQVLVLVDGNKKIPNLKFNQNTIVKGDSKSAVIAAASILAKVERDRYMKELHTKYPYYNWEKNKGYLTKEHIEAIKKHGPCEFHRSSFLKKFSDC